MNRCANCCCVGADNIGSFPLRSDDGEEEADEDEEDVDDGEDDIVDDCWCKESINDEDEEDDDSRILSSELLF